VTGKPRGAIILPVRAHDSRTTEDFPQTMIRWADNIVLARRYIGPVRVE